MSYRLDGEPTPLARARVNYQAKRMYDSQSQLKLVDGITLRQQHGDEPLLEGPLLLTATFYMPMPGKISSQRIAKLQGQYHSFKPDLDNLVKYILDCANGILYHDDALICSMSAIKQYDVTPHTKFTLMEIGHGQKA